MGTHAHTHTRTHANTSTQAHKHTSTQTHKHTTTTKHTRTQHTRTQDMHSALVLLIEPNASMRKVTPAPSVHLSTVRSALLLKQGVAKGVVMLPIIPSINI